MLQRYNFFRIYTNFELKKFYSGGYMFTIWKGYYFFYIFLWKNLEIRKFCCIFAKDFKNHAFNLLPITHYSRTIHGQLTHYTRTIPYSCAEQYKPFINLLKNLKTCHKLLLSLLWRPSGAN